MLLFKRVPSLIGFGVSELGAVVSFLLRLLLVWEGLLD